MHAGQQDHFSIEQTTSLRLLAFKTISLSPAESTKWPIINSFNPGYWFHLVIRFIKSSFVIQMLSTNRLGIHRYSK